MNPALVNIEAERTLLGCVLSDSGCLYQALPLVRAQDFSLDSHRRVFQVITELAEAGKPVDELTLSNALGERRQLEMIGGVAFLTSLSQNVEAELARVTNVEHYAQIIIDKSRRRQTLGPERSILDPDNLYHRYFKPVLTKAGLRKIRLHDLRHTFGSLLIQGGASIVYVKEQMGHSSIQVTVDIYGHLIPGANVSFVDKLDELPKEQQKTTLHHSAPETHHAIDENGTEIAQVADLIGGGEWTRTTDLRIMRPSL